MPDICLVLDGEDPLAHLNEEKEIIAASEGENNSEKLQGKVIWDKYVTKACCTQISFRTAMVCLMQLGWL